MRKPVAVSSGAYYFESIFGEQRLTVWFNVCGGMLVALLIGGAL
jgi:ech hydrogenase subunit A